MVPELLILCLSEYHHHFTYNFLHRLVLSARISPYAWKPWNAWIETFKASVGSEEICRVEMWVGKELHLVLFIGTFRDRLAFLLICAMESGR